MQLDSLLAARTAADVGEGLKEILNGQLLTESLSVKA